MSPHSPASSGMNLCRSAPTPSSQERPSAEERPRRTNRAAAHPFHGRPQRLLPKTRRPRRRIAQTKNTRLPTDLMTQGWWDERDPGNRDSTQGRLLDFAGLEVDKPRLVAAGPCSAARGFMTGDASAAVEIAPPSGEAPDRVEVKENHHVQAPSAKYKLDRRMGENIWGRPKSPINQRSYGPGQHGQRRKYKVSDFGLQLRAKQKLKGYYGNLTEKQFTPHLRRGRPPQGQHLGEPDRPAGKPPGRGGLSRQVRADACSPPASSSTTATCW